MFNYLKKLWSSFEQGQAVVPIVRPTGTSRRDFLRLMGVTTTTVAFGGMTGSLWKPERRVLTAKAVDPFEGWVRTYPERPFLLMGRATPMQPAGAVLNDAFGFVGYIEPGPYSLRSQELRRMALQTLPNYEGKTGWQSPQAVADQLVASMKAVVEKRRTTGEPPLLFPWDSMGPVSMESRQAAADIPPAMQTAMSELRDALTEVPRV